MNAFTLTIVDDHSLFRNGLKLLLSSCYPEIVISEAQNGREFIEMLSSGQPDLVLMDINMPEMDGIAATRKALELFPDLKIIALSMFGDEDYYFKMIDAGVKGFLLKNSELKEVQDAIESVLQGENYFSKELLYNVVKNLRNSGTLGAKSIDLSERELEVLELICKGFSNQEISDQLFISKRTVDKHRANILSKTDSRNTAHLVMKAIRQKWINL